ncbi:hypothetical protein [Massilia sp. DWR3-1-1]|uniref:hypothetical protein n=1 Tax=Massilia sp. DWR3-1-1 TaxID=2804559 RepID=UPI003CF19FAE
MTNKKTPAVKSAKPVKPATDVPAGRPPNPFLDADLYGRMRDYTERDAAFSKELKAIAERGAAKRSVDAREAPSLQVLRVGVKKGLALHEMFARIVSGTESGLWEPWLAQFGFDLLGVNYAKTGARNARIALDLSLGSKATAFFANAGIANWRSLAAEDCAQVQVHKPTETVPAKAYAIFFLDAAEK